MKKGLVISTVVSLIQPAVYSLAGRLFVLTTGRKGSSMYKPTVSTFFETSIVTSLYEQLLMSPNLAHLEIRHEMPYPGSVGAPKQVDLWIRPPYGGYSHIIEAGDFTVRKVHKDLRKAKGLNPKGANWFLAFFRGEKATSNTWDIIDASFKRANGLDRSIASTDKGLTGTFTVYRPDGKHSDFGYAIFRAK